MRREGISSLRWSWVVLALLCVGAIVAAVLVVGPTSSSQASRSRTVTAEKGVVQSTVSGSGSLQVQETDVNFADSGQLVEVKVKPGQHVVEGQVLARIKSNDQRLALDQAEANLTSAEAKLRQAEASASASTTAPTSAVATAAAKQGPTGTTGPSGSGGGGNSGSGNSDSGNSGSNNSSSGQNQSSAANSAATQASNEANIASAQAGVDSAQAAVDSAQQALSATELTAPVTGTVASVNAGVGDFVSGGGSSGTGSSGSSSGSGSNSGSGGGGSGGGNGSSSSSSSSSSGTGSSSSAFIVIVNMHRVDLVVPFSESDIHKVKLHQPATVTVNALPGVELAAHVTAIDTLPTTNSGVVSYNVTLHLDQLTSGPQARHDRLRVGRDLAGRGRGERHQLGDLAARRRVHGDARQERQDGHPARHHRDRRRQHHSDPQRAQRR